MIFYTDGFWTVEPLDSDRFCICYRNEPLPGINSFSKVGEAINAVPITKVRFPFKMRLMYAQCSDGLIGIAIYWYKMLKRDGLYGVDADKPQE